MNHTSSGKAQPELSETRSVITSWLIQIVAILDEFDFSIDVPDLLRRAEVDPDILQDPNARVRSRRFSRFIELIVEATGDETIGLKLAERNTPGSMHALGYSLFSSRTLETFFHRFDRFFRLISHSAETRSEIRKGCLIHSIELKEDVPPVRQDVFLATVLRFVRMVYRADYSPVLVRMRRPKPGKVAMDEFDAFFCCPIEYGHDSLELHVAEKDYTRVLRGANSDIVRRNDQIAMEYIARFDEQQIIPRIRAAIVEMLPDGAVSLESVSRELNTSNRSLQRQLQDEGTTFNTVLDDVRQHLAIGYLRTGRRSIKEISYLLGYKDPSNFSRAFRRLTGQSPQEFLENERQLDDS